MHLTRSRIALPQGLVILPPHTPVHVQVRVPVGRLAALIRSATLDGPPLGPILYHGLRLDRHPNQGFLRALLEVEGAEAIILAHTLLEAV